MWMGGCVYEGEMCGRCLCDEDSVGVDDVCMGVCDGVV